MQVNEKEPSIILIGGAPGTGKSTVAEKISHYLKIPWVSTDHIRRIMRSTARQEDYPALFSAKISADEFLKKFSAQEIADMEMEQSDTTWKGIESMLQNPYPWESFIVEGVNILPRHVQKLNNVKAIFLIDEDQDRLRDVIFNRGLFDEAEKYSDELKEKEIEWVNIFTAILKREVEQYGYPLVEVSKSEVDLKKVLHALEI